MPIWLRVQFLLMLVMALGCTEPSVQENATSVRVVFNYPPAHWPDQIDLKMTDVVGEVLAQLKIPESPKPFSTQGEESIELLLPEAWDQQMVELHAQAFRKGMMISSGTGRFTVEQRSQVIVTIELSAFVALPDPDAGPGGVEVALDGGVNEILPSDMDAGEGMMANQPDAGEGTNALHDAGLGALLDAGMNPTPTHPSDAGFHLDEANDAGHLTHDAGVVHPPDAGADSNSCPLVCSFPYRCVPASNGQAASCADCVEGYALVNNVCEDVDECTTEAASNCRSDQICVNTVGSFECQCPDGQSDASGECGSPCGNNVEEPEFDENCDDGNQETESCDYGLTSCVVCGSACQKVTGETAFCGDGVLHSPQEDCDLGVINNDGSYGGCTSACTLAPYCGDGDLEPDFEVCDLGAADNTGTYQGCNSDCTAAPKCGDDSINADFGETCDGAAGGIDGCRDDCSYCGDGELNDEHGEACDSGDLTNELCPYGEASCQVCNLSCQWEPGETSYCGDGIVDPASERCDGDVMPEDINCAALGFMPPDNNAELTCSDDCSSYNTETCGDVITNVSDGEEMVDRLKELLNDEDIHLIRLPANDADNPYPVSEEIDVDRESAVVLEPMNGANVFFKQTGGSDFMEIKTGGLEGDITIRNLTITNVKKGFDIKHGNGTGWVHLHGNDMRGRLGANSGNSELSYLIRSSYDHTSITQNTLTTETPNDGDQGTAIESSGSCSFVAFNYIEGYFETGIEMDTFNLSLTPCANGPFVDHNTIIAPLEWEYQTGMELGGNGLSVRNNLVMGLLRTTAIRLGSMRENDSNNLVGNHLVYLRSDDCQNGGYCHAFTYCENEVGCSNFQALPGCCEQFCDVDESGSGCVEDDFNGVISEFGCPSPGQSFIDAATAVDYADFQEAFFPVQEGASRDIGAREFNAPFVVGNEEYICAEY